MNHDEDILQVDAVTASPGVVIKQGSRIKRGPVSIKWGQPTVLKCIPGVKLLKYSFTFIHFKVYESEGVFKQKKKKIFPGALNNTPGNYFLFFSAIFCSLHFTTLLSSIKIHNIWQILILLGTKKLSITGKNF